ncbi:conserved hypothetical protein [Gammaproteobacteria bacterium]
MEVSKCYPVNFHNGQIIFFERFPNLSKPQAKGLALWSFGIITAHSCNLNAVANSLSTILPKSFNTIREKLRNSYREASAKPGNHRAELEVTQCWAPFVSWILEKWSGTQLAIALDASSLGDVFVILQISILYRGCSIPIAWKILKANEKHPWKDEWLVLLEKLKNLIPDSWTVIVLADRGLYAKWLYETIVSLKWHPFLRVNSSGCFRPEGWNSQIKFRHILVKKGEHWQSNGISQKNKLSCTLLVCWGEEYKEPWFILTDLAHANVCWYGLRAWIERGFKFSKRGGLQWQYARMQSPERAERLWMAIAIATFWLAGVGGQEECETEELKLVITPASGSVRSTIQKGKKRWRIQSILKLAWTLIIRGLFNHKLILVRSIRPEKWPTWPDNIVDATVIEGYHT